MARHRLRIPKALAVVLVGSSATLAVTFTGCEEAGDGPPATDAPPAMVDDPNSHDIDEALADARIDARPDARPDARRPDAYVPPDTPVV